MKPLAQYHPNCYGWAASFILYCTKLYSYARVVIIANDQNF